MSTNERRKRRRDEREKRSSPRFSRWWISRNKNLRAEMWWPLIVCLIVPTLLCPSLAATAADDRCDWIGRLVLFFVFKTKLVFYLCVIREKCLGDRHYILCKCRKHVSNSVLVVNRLSSRPSYSSKEKRNRISFFSA